MTNEKWQAFKESILKKRYTAMTAIKDKCIECKGGENLSESCGVTSCPIYCFLRQKEVEKAARKQKGISDERLAHLRRMTEKRLENKRGDNDVASDGFGGGNSNDPQHGAGGNTIPSM